MLTPRRLELDAIALAQEYITLDRGKALQHSKGILEITPTRKTISQINFDNTMNSASPTPERKAMLECSFSSCLASGKR
jgi:hypothetical protein